MLGAEPDWQGAKPKNLGKVVQEALSRERVYNLISHVWLMLLSEW